MKKHYFIEDIIAAHTNAGGHFFNKGNMKSFNSIVYDETWTDGANWFFVTSEKENRSKPRLFTIIKWHPAKPTTIDRVGAFQEYKTKARACSAVKRLESVFVWREIKYSEPMENTPFYKFLAMIHPSPSGVYFRDALHAYNTCCNYKGHYTPEQLELHETVFGVAFFRK